MSASVHIRCVITDSAQVLYALRVLCNHGMNDTGLQTVFRATVVSRLTYVSPAWRRFITSAQCWYSTSCGVIRQCKRGRPTDLPDFVKCLWTSLMNGFFVPSSTTRTILCMCSFYLNHKCRKTTSSAQCYSMKSRMMELPFHNRISMTCLAILTKYRSVTDRQTDRQTDGRTQLM